MRYCLKNLLCVFLLLPLLGCVRRTTITDEAITEAAEPKVTLEQNVLSELEVKITEIRAKIIQNIFSGNDIDMDIDVNEINSVMSNYELQPDSYVVSINNKPYDMLVIEELLYSHEIIKSNWEHLKKINMQRIVSQCINIRNIWQVTDEYILMDAISYYLYQSEISEAFFRLLMEQFQLTGGQYELDELPEVTIEVSPLPMMAVTIDGIPFESTAVETIQSLMRQDTAKLTQNIRRDLTDEINTQFGICIRNVDSYLDWYYGFFTGLGKLGSMVKGAIDRNRTMGEALHEYMVKNYMEKIGRGTEFENIMTILQQYENAIIDRAFVFSSLLGDCILEDDASIESIQDISGDDYMAPFITLSDYLNTVVTEGLQIMGMGDKLDTDGVLLLDIANIVINFIPGVGFIAGTIVDIITLKLTEHWKRPDFERSIIYSIRGEQKKLLAVISIDNKGGRNEILF